MSRRLRSLLALAALVYATATAGSAQAQQFIGTVVLPDGTTPLAGVLVVVTDSIGRAVAQGVSSAEGRFTLFVDSSRTLMVTLHRTGFAPTVAATRRLAGDEVVDLIAVLGGTAVRIPTLRRGATTCGRVNAEDRAAMGTALEEVRKALVAAQSMVARNDIAARFVTFEHRTAKTGEDTLRSLARRATGPLPSLFRATTTEELEEGGFFAMISGERVFRAPEPALLASDWFTGTHCFTAQPQGDSVLRLAFRPTRVRKGLVDLEGAYVLDARTLELRRVEFAYQGMREEERQANAGGVLDFVQLANGDWLVSRWHNRVPLLGYRTSDGATTLVRTSMSLIDITGHRVVGGRVLAVVLDRLALMRSDPVKGALANTAFGRACPERIVTQNTGGARGVLVPVDSEPVRDVLVRATWNEPVVVDRTLLTQREHVRETFTDEQGAWLICDIPARRDITLRWEARGQERTIPFTLPAVGTVTTVAKPATP